MTHWHFLLVALTALTFGCAPPSGVEPSEEGTEHDEHAVYAASSSLWQGGSVEVCWENADASNAAGRAWVQDAVATTWESHGVLDFVGWGSCAGKTPNAIRIFVEDAGPHTKGLGNKLAGKAKGMVLNFSFQNWSPSCKNNREHCIRTIAIHEFGHALGFAHEQNRPDTDTSWCNKEQGSNGDVSVGSWDQDSVMNYCNPTWNGAGELSDKDIFALQLLYGEVGLKGSIVNLASDKCLTVQGPIADASSLVQSASCLGDARQRFSRQSAGGGYEYLYTKHNGYCLTVLDESASDGAALVSVPCLQRTAHNFRAVGYSDGSVRLVNRKTQKCAAVAAGSAAEGAALVQQTCDGSQRQRFFLK